MQLNQPGYETDCWIRSISGTVEEKRDYFVIRSPRNPGFYWGNFLLMKRAPASGDVDRWCAWFAAEFGAATGHYSFGWDEAGRGCMEEFLATGFESEETLVATLSQRPPRGEIASGFEVRAVEGDEDWLAVSLLQASIDRPAGDVASFLQFKQRLIADYRESCERGMGTWWGAFRGGRLVGDLGLFIDRDRRRGRFQSVETHPDFRGQGVCTGLLNRASRHAFLNEEVETLIICADPGSQAARIYQRAGFAPVGVEYGLFRVSG